MSVCVCASYIVNYLNAFANTQMKSSCALETWPSCSRQHCGAALTLHGVELSQLKAVWRAWSFTVRCHVGAATARCCSLCCSSFTVCLCYFPFLLSSCFWLALKHNSQHRIRCGRSCCWRRCRCHCRRRCHCCCRCFGGSTALSLSISTSQAVFGVSSKRGSFLSAFCIILLI